MELRVLRYFVTLAEEGNFTKAASRLHLTQPTLSRQIQEMEEELGARLFIRHPRGISLTEEGLYLQRKAEEILALSERAKIEVGRVKGSVSGVIHIACGETVSLASIARALLKIRASYPGISCNLISGNAGNARHWLEDGIASFGLFVLPADLNGLEFITLPHMDNIWGALMRKDDPLAREELITAQALEGKNLICSSQALVANEFAGWFKDSLKKINIVATYSLLFNASILVREGLGVALGLKGIINTEGSSPLCFRELNPPVRAGLALAWKKNSVFSRADRIFIEFFRECVLEGFGK